MTDSSVDFLGGYQGVCLCGCEGSLVESSVLAMLLVLLIYVHAEAEIIRRRWVSVEWCSSSDLYWILTSVACDQPREMRMEGLRTFDGPGFEFDQLLIFQRLGLELVDLLSRV